MIRDTNEARPLMTDEEITFFYTMERNIWRAAASACLSLADGQAVNKSVGDLSIGSKVDTYRSLAADYRRRADADASVYAGGISIADKLSQESNTDRVNPSFTRNLQVNPWNSTGRTT